MREEAQGDRAAAAPEGLPEDPPPFLGSWRRVYLLVLGELAALILAAWALARWAS